MVCGRCGAVLEGVSAVVAPLDRRFCPRCAESLRTWIQGFNASRSRDPTVIEAEEWLRENGPEAPPSIPRPPGYFRLLFTRLPPHAEIAMTQERGEHVLRMETGERHVGWLLSRRKFRRSPDGFIARHPDLATWWDSVCASFGPIRQYGELYMPESLAALAVPNPGAGIARKFSLYRQVRKSVRRGGRRFKTWVTVRSNGPKDVKGNPEGPDAKYVHHRQRSPRLFVPNSFRTIEARRAPEAQHVSKWKGLRYTKVRGAKAVVGRLTDSARERHGIHGTRVKRLAWATQSILVPKKASGNPVKRWSVKRAPHLLEVVPGILDGGYADKLARKREASRAWCFVCRRKLPYGVDLKRHFKKHSPESIRKAHAALGKNPGFSPELLARVRKARIGPRKNPANKMKRLPPSSELVCDYCSRVARWEARVQDIKTKKWFTIRVCHDEHKGDLEELLHPEPERNDLKAAHVAMEKARETAAAAKRKLIGKNPGKIAEDLFKAMRPKGQSMRRRAPIEGKNGVIDELKKMGYSEENARELVDIAVYDLKIAREPVIGYIEDAKLPPVNPKKNPDVIGEAPVSGNLSAENPGALAFITGLVRKKDTRPAVVRLRLPDSDPMYIYGHDPKDVEEPKDEVTPEDAQHFLEEPGMYWRVWYKLFPKHQTDANSQDIIANWLWQAIWKHHWPTGGKYLVVMVQRLDSRNLHDGNVPKVLDAWKIPEDVDRMSRFPPAPPPYRWKPIADKQTRDPATGIYRRREGNA